MTHANLDVNLFYITFAAYFAGFIAFSLYAALKNEIWHKAGSWLMLSGLFPHTTAFISRWTLTGHIPLSNMYEYMSLMSWMSVIMLLLVYYRYKRPAIGTFVSPVVFMLMVAAALLPKDPSQSLMPALRSVWLMIHVSLAALGTGCFLVSFAASSIYLLKKFEPKHLSPQRKKTVVKTAWINLIFVPVGFAIIMSIFGFSPPTPQSHIGPHDGGVNLGGFLVLAGIGFIIGSALAAIFWKPKTTVDNSGFGAWVFIVALAGFLIGALIEGILLRYDLLALTHNLPGSAMTGATKSAWLIFEFFGAAYIIGLILSPLIVSLFASVSRGTVDKLPLSTELLDEISYKSVSLGYPLYTVGALFAGAIWAEQAWGQFWSWDPKEVGSLITWLFYSTYLHARYQRGWIGSRAGVLAVIAFMIVLLSFFGNYFFGGLHAYA